MVPARSHHHWGRRRQLLTSDCSLLTSPCPSNVTPFQASLLTKTHVWVVTFALCPGEDDHDWPLTTEWETFTSSASNAHVPSHPSSIFPVYNAANKAISLTLSFLFDVFFFSLSLRGHGTLFTFISCYLWAQLRLMLQVTALLLHSTAWGGRDEELKKKPKKTAKQSETQSHLRVMMITLTRSGGGGNAIISQTQSWNGAMAHSRFLSSFHPLPHLLLLPLIRSERMWPSRCQTCSASHCGKRYTLQ